MLRLAVAGSALAACSGDAVTTLPPSTTSTTLAAAAPTGAGGPVALATAETDPSTSNPGDVAIWVHPTDPAASRVEVDGAGSVVFEEVRTFSVATQPEGCVADDERRVLYLGEEVARPAPEGGYLIAASQGSGEFVVYELPGEEHVLTFRVGDGDVDGTARTDGIDVVASAIGAGFPNGLFVAHDPQDETGAANFKLVPWERIAALADPPLAVTAGG